MTEVMTEEHIDLDEFVNAYVEAALWSTNDESTPSGGEPLDKNYDESDIDPESLAKMRTDCAAFLNHRLGGRLITIAERLDSYGHWSIPTGADCTVMAYAGHDFWLSRNGHGCGFGDGDWPKGIDEALEALANEFGECHLYLGDDGVIYL